MAPEPFLAETAPEHSFLMASNFIISCHVPRALQKRRE